VTPPIRYARSGETNIAYQVTGEGPFDLVLVHGFFSHLELDWEHSDVRRFHERLASFSRLIRFDKRGTGLSDRAVGLPDLETRMDDVRAVMDAVGSDDAALFGFSEGGPLSVLFAATYPQRTRALVLYGTYAKRLRSDDYPWAPTWENRLRVAAELEADWGENVDLSTMIPGADPAMAEWFARRGRAALSPAAARDLILMNAKVDVRDVLPAIQSPTLVLHRTGDLDSRVEEGRYIAGRIPGARFVELPGNVHVPWVGMDDVLAEVEEFLTGTRPAPAGRRELATILFTDLVGSTDRLRELGDAAWAALLARHNEAVRGELRRTAGWRSTQPATASSRSSTAPPGRSAPASRSGRRSSRSDSTSASASTRARSSATRDGRAESRCGSRPASCRRRPPARCSSRRPRVTSSRAPASPSTTAASTSSKGSRRRVASSPRANPSWRRNLVRRGAFLRTKDHRDSPPEPGLARREARRGARIAAAKERVRGGTMGSPTLGGRGDAHAGAVHPARERPAHARDVARGQRRARARGHVELPEEPAGRHEHPRRLEAPE
jgi:pimeloyl-ACP methyl ester carboxylesterase